MGNYLFKDYYKKQIYSEKTVNISENQYLDLLKKVVNEGEIREGRNGETYSLFGEKLEFNIAEEGFPLLTTKRVFWRGVVEELLWFLRGSTDSNELSKKGVHIWRPNTTREFLDKVGLDYKEGECGPIYSYQWRCFGGEYPTRKDGIDQIAYIINELRTKPHGRRAVLSAWNPKQMHMMCLPPCHTLYQFYMSNKGLSCQMYARSQDLPVGTPFNIASTTLLTCIIAKILDVPVYKVIIVIGDAHIYSVHKDGVATQISREPYKYPKLNIKKEINKEATISNEYIMNWIENLTYEDFEIENYVYHPTIKMDMIA